MQRRGKQESTIIEKHPQLDGQDRGRLAGEVDMVHQGCEGNWLKGGERDKGTLQARAGAATEARGLCRNARRARRVAVHLFCPPCLWPCPALLQAW